MIAVDIHGTITHAAWREPIIQLQGWDEYYAQAAHDEPCKPIIRLINGLVRTGEKVVGMTETPERYRELTMRWLVYNNVLLDEIYMRPEDDWRSAVDLKMSFLDEMPEQVSIAIDDSEAVIDAFRARGITTLHINGR